MSKLSDGLKALISAAHARPGYTKAPSNIKSIFQQFAQDAQSRKVGFPTWVTLSTATSMTLNCPEAMTQLFELTREAESTQHHDPVTTAELIREVGLKCISFNGIPRSINCLGAFYNDLPTDIKSKLSTTPTRDFTPSNLEARKQDGLALWDSVYYGVERKLLGRLAQSHPDLPVHIINSHYSNLLSDPPQSIPGPKVGRVLTSLVAITCLRAQTGVGPQVTSHIFGLRKAYERGDAHAEGEEAVEGGEWLASEEGNRWILESIDGLINAIAGIEGTTFAPGLRPKL